MIPLMCVRRSRSIAAVVVVVLASMLFPLAALGQEPPPELDVVEVTTTGNQVILTVVAPPELRSTEVSLGSFVVDMGNGPVAPTVTLVAGDDLDVVLLVDVSGSMAGEALAAAKVSGAAFVEQLPANTRVAVVSFGDDATVAQPFTTSTEQAVATLNALEAGGETAMHAAVVTAAQQFDPTSDSVRTIVLLSDGGNTVAKSSLGQAQATLESSGATLHAISIDTEEADDGELEALALASGGTVARVDQIEAIAALQRAIAEDLGNQYRLGFLAEGEGEQVAVITAQVADQVLAQISLVLTLPVSAVSQPFQPAPQRTSPQLVEPTAPSASTPTVASTDVGSDRALKWISIASVSVAIAAIGLVLLIPQRDRRRVRPAQRFGSPQRRDASQGIRWIASRLADGVEGLLSRRGIGQRLAEQLDAAGWKVRTAEFIVLILLGSIAGFLAAATRSLLAGVVVATLIPALVLMFLRIKVKRRRSVFADFLTPTLQMLAGALRTGYSLPQSLALVAKESEGPVSEEFARVVIEMRLGRDLVEAIEAVAHRMDNADFLWATSAIEIAREVGGDLAGVLDNVASTVRTRDRIRRQIQSLSAEGRISAWILIILPFPLFFWQFIVNRAYTMLLFTDEMGRLFLIGGVTLLIVGTVWLRSQIQIDY